MWEFLIFKLRHFEYFSYLFENPFYFAYYYTCCFLRLQRYWNGSKVLHSFIFLKTDRNDVKVLNYIYIINWSVIYFHTVAHAQLVSFPPKNKFFLLQQYFTLRYFNKIFDILGLYSGKSNHIFWKYLKYKTNVLGTTAAVSSCLIFRFSA